ncbi:ABC transporter substrate-binding protein [Staphylococcus borealis]|uniref:ABC transporter substrate-binding protein n=1 Tax=Staphylococcus borealis TaxID=2742203 RepID=UPI0039EC1FA4
MKKLLPIFLCIALFLMACGNHSSNKSESQTKSDDKQSTMRIFTTEKGKKVKVPTHPKRIVVLHPTLVGALVKFNHKPIAVPEFVNQNKTLNEATKGIKRINNKSVEQVAKEKPDLIITTAEDKNIKKLEKVAPTISFNMANTDYKETTRKLGELVGEKKQAEDWISDWENQLKKDKKELASFINGKTATVIQQTPKGTMVFSDHMGRGTEIIYNGYGLKQPETLKKAMGKKFAMPISPEKFSQYLGDIIVIAQNGNQSTEFENKDTWKNLAAVQKGHVIKFNVKDTQYNDPISLEKQHEIFYKALKKMKDDNN